MGFAWSFLESTTAFSKAGDWVTMVAVEDCNRRSSKYVEMSVDVANWRNVESQSGQ